MRRISTILIALLLTACSSVPPATTPTSSPVPRPTQAALTPTRAATSTQPSSVTPAATATPAASPTFTPLPPTATLELTATPQLTPTQAGLVKVPAVTLETPLSAAAWSWTSSELKTGLTQVTYPSHYMLLFGEKGKLSAQIDCVIAEGTYQIDGANLQLKLADADVSGCPYGTQAGQFKRELSQVSAYTLKDGKLGLTQSAGVTWLAPYALVPLQAPASGAASAQLTAFALVHSGPGSSFPIYGALPAGATTSIVARNFESGWWAVGLKGYPDQMGWIDPGLVKTSSTDATPYRHVDTLQVGQLKLLWPDITDAMASMVSPAPILAGPGKPYPVLLMGLPGDTLYMVGRSADGQYVVVYLGADRVAGGLGWIATADVEVRNAALAPVFPAPALPIASSSYQPQADEPIAAALTEINVRSGPDLSFSVLTTLRRGEIVQITGQTSDRLWWRIKVPTRLSPDGNAWVAQTVVRSLNTEHVADLGNPFPFPYVRPDTANPACVVVKQTPANETRMPRGTDFTITFTLLNDTTFEWSDDNIDLVYIDNIDNALLHLDASRLDLEDSAQPGQTVTFSFKAQAPTKHAGVFGERWVLRKDGATVCSFTYTVRSTD